MNLSTTLETRCANQCELCTSSINLSAHLASPKTGQSEDHYVVICQSCEDKIHSDQLDDSHWRCLTESIWSPVPAVQVISYRLLNKLNKPWAQDLINTMYMDENTREWAESFDDKIVHMDSNGHVLKNGDSVVLIKDLSVKGAGFVAKRGAAVRRITLVHDNAQHIQGKINDQTIIILTKYVKKT